MNKLVDDEFKEFKNSRKDLRDIDKLKNLSKYRSYRDLIEQHFDMCLKIRDYEKNRYVIDLMETQKKIISKVNQKGKKISENDIISIIKDNKNNFSLKDFFRLICLIKYNYPKINLESIYKYINISPKEKELLNNIEKEKFPVDIGKLEELNNIIILHREKTIYNTNDENKNDKPSTLTTICDMLFKDELPDNLFTYVEKADLKFEKKFNINLGGVLINDKDNDEIKQNLILFNIGGLSNYEVASLERGFYMGQHNMNLILGGNKIYNHEEYFKELEDYYNIKKNNKNPIVKTEEKYTVEKKEYEKKNVGKKDTKVEININNDSKGSKEKMKKKGKNDSQDDDTEFP